MPLPLLALKVAPVSAPFPDDRITIVLSFEPFTKQTYRELSFDGPFVLMSVSPSMSTMPPATKLVAERCAQWVSEGLKARAGDGIELSNGKRYWSISWSDFSSSLAHVTCKSVNSPGGAASVPYTLVDFQQTLLDDRGQQTTKFVFAHKSESQLSEWVKTLP